MINQPQQGDEFEITDPEMIAQLEANTAETQQADARNSAGTLDNIGGMFSSAGDIVADQVTDFGQAASEYGGAPEAPQGYSQEDMNAGYQAEVDKSRYQIRKEHIKTQEGLDKLPSAYQTGAQLTAGAASLVPLIGASVVTAPVSGLALLGGGLIAGAQQYATQAGENIDKGKDMNQAKMIGSSLLDGAIQTGIGKAGSLLGAGKALPKAMGISAGEGSIGEGVSNTITNAATGKDLTENLGASMALGGVAGGALHGGMHAAGKGIQKVMDFKQFPGGNKIEQTLKSQTAKDHGVTPDFEKQALNGLTARKTFSDTADDIMSDASLSKTEQRNAIEKAANVLDENKDGTTSIAITRALRTLHDNEVPMTHASGEVTTLGGKRIGDFLNIDAKSAKKASYALGNAPQTFVKAGGTSSEAHAKAIKENANKAIVQTVKPLDEMNSSLDTQIRMEEDLGIDGSQEKLSLLKDLKKDVTDLSSKIKTSGKKEGDTKMLASLVKRIEAGMKVTEQKNTDLDPRSLMEEVSLINGVIKAETPNIESLLSGGSATATAAIADLATGMPLMTTAKIANDLRKRAVLKGKEKQGRNTIAKALANADTATNKAADTIMNKNGASDSMHVKGKGVYGSQLAGFGTLKGDAVNVSKNMRSKLSTSFKGMGKGFNLQKEIDTAMNDLHKEGMALKHQTKSDIKKRIESVRENAKAEAKKQAKQNIADLKLKTEAAKAEAELIKAQEEAKAEMKKAEDAVKKAQRDKIERAERKRLHGIIKEAMSTDPETSKAGVEALDVEIKALAREQDALVTTHGTKAVERKTIDAKLGDLNRSKARALKQSRAIAKANKITSGAKAEGKAMVEGKNELETDTIIGELFAAKDDAVLAGDKTTENVLSEYIEGAGGIGAIEEKGVAEIIKLRSKSIKMKAEYIDDPMLWVSRDEYSAISTAVNAGSDVKSYGGKLLIDFRAYLFGKTNDVNMYSEKEILSEREKYKKKKMVSKGALSSK